MIEQTEDGKLWESIMNKVLDENHGEMGLMKLNEEVDKRFIRRKNDPPS